MHDFRGLSYDQSKGSCAAVVSWDMGVRQSQKLKCCFTSTETMGLLRTGAQDVHLEFHTAPEL